jgi:hypothetical protein
MAGFGIREEQGGVKILDDGVTLVEKARSIDFTGDMVEGTAIEADVTETIDSSIPPISGYLLLAGRIGGQTAQGGTQAGDDLTFFGNSSDGGYVHLKSAVLVGFGEGTDNPATMVSANTKDTSPPPELFTNEGFEDWTYIEFPDGWEYAGNPDSPGYAASKTTDSHSGTYALYTNGGGDIDGFSGLFQSYTDLEQSDTYTMKFWGKGSGKTATIGYAQAIEDISVWWAFTGPNAGTWVDLNPSYLTDGGLEVWVGDETPKYFENIGDAGYLVTKSLDSDVGTYAMQLNGDLIGPNFSGAVQFIDGLTYADSYTFTCRAKNLGDFYLVYVSDDDDTGDTYYWNFTLQQWDSLTPDLVSDGDMELWTDPNTLTQWTDFPTGGGSPTLDQETVNVYSGLFAAKMTPDAGTALGILQTQAGIGTAGDNLWFIGHFATASSGTVTVAFLNGAGDEIWNFTTQSWDAYAGPPPSSDQRYEFTGVGTEYIKRDLSFTIPTDEGITVQIVGDSSVVTYVDSVHLRFGDARPSGPDYFYGFTTTASYATYTSPAVQMIIHATENLGVILVANAEILIDNVTLRKDGTGDNILKNYSFENWFTAANTDPNVLANWNELYYGVDTYYLEQTTKMDDPDYVYSGYSSAKLAAWGGTYYIYQNADCSALDEGHELGFQAYVLSPNMDASIFIYFLNHGGDQVYNFNTQSWDAYVGGEPTGDNIIERTATSTWADASIEVKVPADKHIVCYVGVDGGANVYMDSIRLVENIGGGAPSSDYFHTFNLTGDWAEYTSPSPQVIVPEDEEITALIGSVDTGATMDDYSLLKDGTSPDIATNGGFETWTFYGYAINDWEIGNYYDDGGDVFREETIVHGGTYSLKIDNDGTGRNYVGQVVGSLTAGTDYDISIYATTDLGSESELGVMVLNDIEQDATQIWNFTLGQWDAFSGGLSGQGNDYRDTTSLTSSWSEWSDIITAHASEKMFPLFYSVTTDLDVYLDDASFKIEATGGTPTIIWDFTNENDFNDLDENDVIFRVRTDDETNSKTFFEVKGDGSIDTEFDSFVFNSDIEADNLSGTNTGDQNDHGLLTGLSDDDHTQYVKNLGRASSQYVYGNSGGSGALYLRGAYTGLGEVSIGNGLITVNESTNAIYFGGNILFPDRDGNIYPFDNNAGNGHDMYLRGGNATSGMAMSWQGGDLILGPGAGVDGGASGDVIVSNLTSGGIVMAVGGTGSLYVTQQISELWIVAAHELETFTNNSGNHEFGETENDFTLSWTYNRNGDDPTAQSIDNGIGGLSETLRSYNVTGAGLTTTTTYTISAIGDDTNPSDLSTTVNFYWKRYYGVSTGDVFSGADVMSVLAPQGAEYGTARADSESFTSGVNPTYYYFAYPAAWGAVAGWTFNGFTQDVGDLEYSNGADAFGASPTNVSLTNASGGTADYYIVRSVYQYQNTTDTVAIS